MTSEGRWGDVRRQSTGLVEPLHWENKELELIRENRLESAVDEQQPTTSANIIQAFLCGSDCF